MTRELTVKDLRIRGEWAGVPVDVQDELATRFGAHHATSIVWLWGLTVKVGEVDASAPRLVENARKSIETNPALLKHAPGLDEALGVDAQ